MRLEFHYVKATHGCFPWSAYTLVTELVEGRETRTKLEVTLCNSKWGARYALKKLVRQHIKSGLRKAHHSEVVNIE